MRRLVAWLEIEQVLGKKMNMDEQPQGLGAGRSILNVGFAYVFGLVPLICTLLYGVAGKDKFSLLSPLVIAGYLILLGWMLTSFIRRRREMVGPPAFNLFLLFIAFGAGLSMVCEIGFDAKIRMLMIGTCAGAYFLWANTLASFRSVRMVLGALLLFTVLLCMYGLINRFKNPEMVLWAERWTDQYIGGSWKTHPRLASTYICPNHFAHLLQMVLPFCLVLLFIPRAGWILRILAGYCIILFVPTMYYTESRAGILGALAAVGITLLLLSLRKSKKLFVLLLVLVPLFSMIFLLGAWKQSEMFRRRMEPVVEFVKDFKENGIANTKTQDFRPLTWLDSLEMIKEKPLTGFGPASYNYVYPKFRHRFKGVRIISEHPHNEYLEIAAEYGWIGLALFGIMWCYGLIRILIFSLKTKHQHQAFISMAFLGTAAGTMVHSFFDFQMHQFQNALVFCLLAALAVGPMCRAKREQIAEGGESLLNKLRPWFSYALGGVVVFALFLSVRTFSSEFLRATADKLVKKASADEMIGPEKLAGKRKMEAQSVELYHRALKFDSSNWRAYNGIGKVLYPQRHLSLEPDKKKKLAEKERAALEKALALNPYDAELCLHLGQTRIFLGDQEGGLKLLKQSAKTFRYNDICWWTLGVAQRKAGLFQEALDTFNYAKKLRNTESIRANIKWLEEQLQEQADGTWEKEVKRVNISDLMKENGLFEE
ncbi:MAG: O-antigen ligase family protein [Pontiellaceae bacterium]|nr:O-antigen ligase family protein [Pontiellaceae bacterium]